jgi:F-type H+-transporting ATPase subunit b
VNGLPLKRAKTAAFLAAGGAFLFGAATAWAEGEGGGGWRATWDLALMWINFVILAFFIVKYLRVPLMNFLHGESRKTAEAIQEAEETRARVAREMQAARSAIENSRERFAAVKERIVTEGERRRLELIESARRESQLMLERARQGAEHQLAEAHERLRAELVDGAIAAAQERLPALIQAEDQEKLIERFIREA